MSTLFPVPSTGAVIPALFLEARMLQEHGCDAVAQMGVSMTADQCNLAVMTRTSGTLLVFGVGGYCVYRMWVRLFGKNLICTLFDSTNLGRVPRADVRFLSRGSSPVHIISKELGAHLMREARQGFASLPLCTSTPKRTRRFRSDDSVSIRSDLTSVSRQRPPRSRQQNAGRISCCSKASGSQSVVATSECSTSLRLIWDGDQMWDDEFADKEVYQLDRVGSPVPSEISEMSAAIKLRTMFDNMDLEEESRVPSSFDPEGSLNEDFAALIQTKCLNDSQYMYQSVMVPRSDIAASEVMSTCSEMSNLSVLKERAKRSQGLWELTSSTGPSTSAHFLQVTADSDSPMTDSCFSRSTMSVRSMAPPPSNNQLMFDSAIAMTEFVSSEDDRSSVRSSIAGRNSGILDRSSSGLNGNGAKYQPSAILRRTCLENITERPSSNPADSISIAQSERSLEWCDDDIPIKGPEVAVQADAEREELIRRWIRDCK
ncbi:hypothetical protein QR680_006718 [Steinernema hermaphroditum]|uniref:Uncharacterized protein n=1 Tax=Steinernema hermaphroditum TaxID=289476 RepID=A0AA39HXW1_9BILA|nr:hypothetical protein QR680_006718 [Steinernema hermaphroditum]